MNPSVSPELWEKTRQRRVSVSSSSVRGGLEKPEGAAGDGAQIVFPSGERCVGDVLEADLDLVAGKPLVEVLHFEADCLVMICDDAPEVEGGERGIPWFPEGEPRDFI